MKCWEKFEADSTEYLKRSFGMYATFDRNGGSNSTISDISVATNAGRRFCIEAKSCPAQCGQFVLLPNLDKRAFDYSPLNVTALNKYSAAIIEYMNLYFDEYKEAGTTGRDIDMENGSAIFAAWIIQAYKNKGAEFIITNGNIILPIEDFLDYFPVPVMNPCQPTPRRSPSSTSR